MSAQSFVFNGAWTGWAQSIAGLPEESVAAFKFAASVAARIVPVWSHPYLAEKEPPARLAQCRRARGALWW